MRGRGVAGEVRCPGVVDDTFGRVVGTSHTINIHAVQEGVRLTTLLTMNCSPTTYLCSWSCDCATLIKLMKLCFGKSRSAHGMTWSGPDTRDVDPSDIA